MLMPNVFLKEELDATRLQSVYAHSTREQLARLDKENDESVSKEALGRIYPTECRRQFLGK